jgi:hypothetical protein
MSIMRFDPFRELDRLGQLLSQSSGAARQVGMPMDAYRDGDSSWFISTFLGSIPTRST